MKTLKDRLNDWMDWDVAAYELGVILGLWDEFGCNPGKDLWNGYKGIMWSRNNLGEYLSNALDELANIGILEHREEPDIQYRYNQNYKLEI